jgi:Pectate lyase superfamily protein
MGYCDTSHRGPLRRTLAAIAAATAATVLALASPASAQTSSLVPNAAQQFFNAQGQPLAGGSVYFYVPNTTTPKTVWSDAFQTTPISEPVVLNSGGFPTNGGSSPVGIFGTGNYQEVVYDAQGNLIWNLFTSAGGLGGGGSQQCFGVNAQTGTSYTFVSSDNCQLVTFNNAASVAVTLPAPSVDTAFQKWSVTASNLGAGPLVITTAAGATIGGKSSLTVSTGAEVWIISDGVNYQIVRIVATPYTTTKGDFAVWGDSAGTSLADVSSVQLYGENIISYGADPTGVNDSTLAIQSAIDAAALKSNWTHEKNIFCPPGKYKTTYALFLDPPGNLRGADGTNGPTYAAGTTYSVGYTVNYLGVPYISLQNSNTGNTPSGAPAYWQPFNWSSATTYAINAVVRFNGTPWISLQNGNTNNAPNANTVGSFWWAPTTIVSTNIDFSLTFAGQAGIGSGGEPYGCIINYVPQNASPNIGVPFTAFWVGTGQGMAIENIELTAPFTGPNALQNPTGVGIAIAGGSGGAQRTLISGVEVDNFYTLFTTGQNSDGLGAETTWRKVDGGNCAIGVAIEGTQNDINNFDT